MFRVMFAASCLLAFACCRIVFVHAFVALCSYPDNLCADLVCLFYLFFLCCSAVDITFVVFRNALCFGVASHDAMQASVRPP